jgi:hypothetical protein
VPKFKNIGDAVDLYAPAGSGDSLFVDIGQTVEVPGTLAKSLQKKELADAGISEMPDDAVLLVLPNGDIRAFPTAQWELVETKKTEPQTGRTTDRPDL